MQGIYRKNESLSFKFDEPLSLYGYSTYSKKLQLKIIIIIYHQIKKYYSLIYSAFFYSGAINNFGGQKKTL